MSDQDCCPRHIFMIKHLEQLKQQNIFEVPGQNFLRKHADFNHLDRADALIFFLILLNTFIDLLPSPNTCKGTSHAIIPRTVPGPRK